MRPEEGGSDNEQATDAPVVFGEETVQLRCASLKDMELTTLADLPLRELANLRTLCVAGNHLADAKLLGDCLSQLPQLSELDISRNRLVELPELTGQLSVLDASQNGLESSRGLRRCIELRRVHLNKNCIQRMEQFETLQHLEELNLKHNQLGPNIQAALRTLAPCQRLVVLNVACNPMEMNFFQLSDLIPSLVVVDGHKVQSPYHLRARSVSYAVLSRCASQRRERPKQVRVPYRLEQQRQRRPVSCEVRKSASAPRRAPARAAGRSMVAVGSCPAVTAAPRPPRAARPKPPKREVEKREGSSTRAAPARLRPAERAPRPASPEAAAGQGPPSSPEPAIPQARLSTPSPPRPLSKSPTLTVPLLAGRSTSPEHTLRRPEAAPSKPPAEVGSATNLSQLIEEKRRLINRVSAKLAMSGGDSSEVLERHACPPVPSTRSQTPPAQTEGQRRERSPAHSLQETLRERIEKKCALLEQLRKL